MFFKSIALTLTITTYLIASNNAINSIEEHIQNTLTFIKDQKDSIMLELRDTFIIGRKAKFALKNEVGAIYFALKAKIKNTIDYIIFSEEFINALNEVTDYQVHCICEKNIAFENIVYELNAPLTRKIDSELEAAFPELDEKTNTFFNIFYVTLVNIRGCKLLLHKLEKEEKRLKKLLDPLLTN